MSDFLSILENEVQVAALSFMAFVYALRLVWLFRFRSAKEKTYAAGSAAAGIFHSLLNIAMPWGMESTRRHPLFYLQFVLLHIGAAAAIALSLVIPYWPALLQGRWAVVLFRVVIGAALTVGLYRLWRRISVPAIRLISTADDFLSLILINLFFAAAFAAAPNRFWVNEWPLIVYFSLTTLLLVYVPFSKIGHYLYYPFTQFFFGRMQGHRGVIAKKPFLTIEGNGDGESSSGQGVRP